MIQQKKKAASAATRNACKLCSPLGAALAFKGIRGCVPLLHGSQGCSTYIRRYLISHYKEPVDIACSNFAEETAIFGGGINLKIALDNVRKQYQPAMIGVATTCLSETIGDDVPLFIREYRSCASGDSLPPIVYVSTPSYRGSHMQGFHDAILAVVDALAEKGVPAEAGRVNLFPGMVSPADLRYLKEIFADMGVPLTLLPDYSQTLDGPLWLDYHRIPEGGAPLSDIRQAGSALATLELGSTLAAQPETAGMRLRKRFDVPCFRLGLPIGIRETDRLFEVLEAVTGKLMPEKHAEERGRLTDALVDGHKYVSGVRAVVYGEEDLVVGISGFLSEIGVIPVLCASGGKSGHLSAQVTRGLMTPDADIRVMDDVDFVDIEAAAADLKPDILVGSSKGYGLSRRIGVPLIRVGFPIHDRVGGARLLHLGYRGAQQLFDRIANAIIEKRQGDSSVGYSYI